MWFCLQYCAKTRGDHRDLCYTFVLKSKDKTRISIQKGVHQDRKSKKYFIFNYLYTCILAECCERIITRSCALKCTNESFLYCSSLFSYIFRIKIVNYSLTISLKHYVMNVITGENNELWAKTFIHQMEKEER